MAKALARRATAMMHNAHIRQVSAFGDAVQPHAPVVVLEVEEELRIEPARRIDRLAPHQHARARHDRNVDDGLRAGRKDAITQLVRFEPFAKPSANESWR